LVVDSGRSIPATALLFILRRLAAAWIHLTVKMIRGANVVHTPSANGALSHISIN